jgi:Leucine-rich repeat (LRR) protein
MNYNKKFLALFGFLIIGLVFFKESKAQNLNPPRNLTYHVEDDNDTYLFWNPPAGDSVYVHWDNGFNDGTFDIESNSYDCAVRWDTTNLGGYHKYKIKKIRFYLVNAPAELKIKLWTGKDPVEVYTQDVTTFNVGDWTEVLLDSVFVIDASEELRAGLYVKVADTAGVVGVDAGPVIPEYGNLYYSNGQWKTQIAGNWNIQLLLEAPPEPTYLHWDGPHTDNYFGFLLDGSREYACAAKWNPEHLTEYDKWKITSVRYVLQSMYFMSLKIKIWQGPEREEVYSQDITEFNDKDWTETQLDTPFEVDASKEIYVGIYVKVVSSGFPIGMDTSQLIVGQGFWLHYNNNGFWKWYEGSDPDIAIHNNMNLRIRVEPVKKGDEEDKGEKGLLGYNVYRDGNLLTPNPVTSTSYVDMNLVNGLYDYWVTAVYDEGESVSGDTVSVLIDQPVILKQDSLALVDLYNQCGGENWFNNDEWLKGPVNEWDGIYTEGNRVVTVWLSLNNLTGDLPESIGDLTALKVMHLEGNYIESIPETIGNMDSLELLWISSTNVHEIPVSIGNLSNLKDFNLTSLDLSQSGLPDAIGNLASLEYLGLGMTGLSALPETFGNMDSLKYLYCYSNQLTQLPANFGHLHNMRYLSIGSNAITFLPDNFGEMTKLHTLFMEDNQITELPDNFGDLTSLYFMNASGNQLEYLPDNFGNLSKLSFLFLMSNNLSEFPESFGNLSSLDTLWAFHNQLASLPDNFGDLDELSDCDLSYNLLEQLPESIGDLATIKYLRINVNTLSSVPESIGNLSSLKLLELAVNQIQEIPITIKNMTSLKTLNLNQNLIAEIPPEIGEMDSLENLGISYNKLYHIPSSLGDLELFMFTLNGNYLTDLPASMFDNTYHYLYIQDNNLQFGSIEPFIYTVQESFKYAPQDKIGNDTTIVLEQGSELSYTVDVSGDYNKYQWYKDGIELTGFTSNELYFESLTVTDEGTYVLKVTNDIVPDLELVSNDVVLAVTVGVEDVHAGDLRIYPNPVSGNILLLDIPGESAVSVSVYDLAGKRIEEKKGVKGNIRVDMSAAGSGMYLVRVYYPDGKILTKKFIKE